MLQYLASLQLLDLMISVGEVPPPPPFNLGVHTGLLIDKFFVLNTLYLFYLWVH